MCDVTAAAGHAVTMISAPMGVQRMTHVHDLIHTAIPYGTLISASVSITTAGDLSVWPQRDTRDLTTDEVCSVCVCVCTV